VEDISIDLIALEESNAELAKYVIERIKHAPGADPSEFLARDGSVAFAATIDDEPVGWAYGYVLERPDGDRTMLLYEMEVAAPWRRKGIGRQLVGAFRDSAAENRCSSMWLITDDDNVSA
jgi:GNAT superfamily N-acetyltransferase